VVGSVFCHFIFIARRVGSRWFSPPSLTDARVFAKLDTVKEILNSMFPIQAVSSFEQLKLISDPRRLAILRQLMAGPASLTMLGRSLHEHPAWVRHHLAQLESAGLVELVETRSHAGAVEKFYRARASGFLVQELILPQNPARPLIVFSGSHDLAMELLAKMLSPHVDILTLPVGSLDGLVALRQNICNIAGAHLLDSSGEYNLPFVHHIFPDREMQVVTLAHREQGLMVAPGNPRSIRSLVDLSRPDLTFINRNAGSGTRLWLDRQLQRHGISPQAIPGFKDTVSTHTECARRVQAGSADVALGLRAAARQHDLDFIPLFHERYDIVFMKEQAPLLAPLLENIQQLTFRRGVKALTGYEVKHTGEQIL
jgi:molybdate-binding protein/DNA-binding HxlR family transcriptional regulator